MKKVFALLLLCAFTCQSFATSVITPSRKAADIYVPIGATGARISLLELSKLDLKSLERLTGRHLGVADKIGFKLAQRHLRNSIKPDGTINTKKLERYIDDEDHSRGFHIGGFALGFFVGLVGVLIAYLIKDDIKRNRVKWAWIGFGISVVLSIVLVAMLISSMTFV